MNETDVIIERLLTINDPDEKEKLWGFYNEVFRPLNEETPIAQTWPKEFFIPWLENPRVIKFVAKCGDEIVGLGVVTDEIKLDYLLSPVYFEKHFPGRPVFHIPIIAILSSLRGTKTGIKLLRAMMNEIPKEALCVFFHSKTFSSRIPQFADFAGAGHVRGSEVDAEACCIFEWTNRKKVDLCSL